MPRRTRCCSFLPPLRCGGVLSVISTLNVAFQPLLRLFLDSVKSSSSFCSFGKLSLNSLSALQAVWSGVLNMIASRNQVLALGTVLRVAVRVQIFLPDIEATDHRHFVVSLLGLQPTVVKANDLWFG